MSFRNILMALAFAFAPGLAFAEDEPLDIRPPDAKSAKHAKEPKDGKEKTGISAAEAVRRANAFFEATRILNADFAQVGPDGKRSQGTLNIERPGHMLFHYEPPAKLEIVADGRTVAVRDLKLHTQDLYFLAQTPLKFLLADHIDITHDTKVLGVDMAADAVTIRIEDHATAGGTSRIALVFDADVYRLKQWTVADPQGYQTVVSLSNLEFKTKSDPEIFKIVETPSNAGGGQKR